MTLYLSKGTEEQIQQCLNLLKEVMEENVLSVYLYGSAVYGGLEKYSDLDLLVVVN